MTKKATKETRKSRNRSTPKVFSSIQKKAQGQSPNNSNHEPLLDLHRNIGNQMVGRLYRSGMLQARLKIGRPNDKYEREADHVADRVMNIPDASLQRQVTPGEEEEIQQKPLSEKITPLVQRQSEEEEDIQTRQEEEEPVQKKSLLQKQEESEEDEVQTKAEGPGVKTHIPNFESSVALLKGNGSPLPKPERKFFEPRFGADFRNVKIHSDSNAASLAKAIRAKAFTVGNNIVFGQGQFSPGTVQGRRLLGHELVHTIQQKRVNSKPFFKKRDQYSPNYHGKVSNKVDGRQLQLEPEKIITHDDVVVANAKKRLPILRNFVSEWQAREIRRLRIAGEKKSLLKARKEMDEKGSDLGEAINPGQRSRIEKQNLAKLNRKPLQIDVTDTNVNIHVKFHVRFENPAHKNLFGKVKSTVQRGIDLIWKQRLMKTLMGRQFAIIPDVKMVSASAKRDRNYWLITVRPSDQAPLKYAGCTFDAPPKGVVVAATDSNCDGGVMSLPPGSVGDASMLGHEMLHLFGLVDRYMMLTHRKGRKVTTSLSRTRATGGRTDPLGGETGKVLVEDLALLFDKLGVYKAEESRGLNTLKKMEPLGMTLQKALIEIRKCEAIIKHGRDPESLLPIRKDFRKEILDSVRNL